MEQKDRAFEIVRELSEQEICHIRKINSREEDVSKIFELNSGNWNLMQLKNGSFISIPKDGNTASPSYYGDLEHTKKYNILFYLRHDSTRKIN